MDAFSLSTLNEKRFQFDVQASVINCGYDTAWQQNGNIKSDTPDIQETESNQKYHKPHHPYKIV